MKKLNTKLNVDKRHTLNLNSGAIHIENKMSLKQRLVWFYLAWRAIPILQQLDKKDLEEKVLKLKVDLSEIKKAIRYSGHNNERIKEILNYLLKNTIKWNIFNKDAHIWGGCTLLSFYEVESKNDKAICTFAFNPFIQARLAYPEMYAKINMLISNNFSSKNALGIYCIALDYLDIKKNYTEKFMTIEDIRFYLGISEEEYKLPADLYRWVIKRAEKDINEGSDMKINIEVRKENDKPKGKIIGFKLKMSIKEDFLEFYKSKKTVEQISKQSNFFDNNNFIEAPEDEIKKTTKENTKIKVENLELKKFYAEHKTAINTDTVQNKFKEIIEMFHDKFEDYLLFLMNYVKQESNKKAITTLSGFYIGLLKDDSQLDNYVFYIQKQKETEQNKKHKVKTLIENELESRYEKFISTDFEKYLEKNIDKLESKMIKVIESTLKGGDFLYDVIIIKFHNGKIDKTLITASKPSVKPSIVGYLKSYKDELGYKTISFDEWKKQLTEKYLQELESEIEKNLSR